MSTISLMFKREWLRAYRQRADFFNPWIFFLLVIVLFPLGLSPEPALMTRIAPGIVWVAIVLTTLLSLEKLFRREVEEGVIEQWLLAPVSFQRCIFIQLVASWCVTYLPLLIFMPIVAIGLQLSLHTLIVALISFLLATPALYFIGAIFCALTVQLRNNGLLLAIIVLPFYIPVLIFAASAMADAQSGLPVGGQLALLAAITTLTLPLAPYATAAALKIGIT